MSLTLVTGPANSGKAEFALSTVRDHLARGRSPLLVVPHAADRVVYLRELAGERVVFGADVVTFGGLERQLADSAGVERRPIDAATREALLAASLAAAGAPYRSPPLVESAGELVAALRAKRVPARQLERALAVAGGPQALDVGLLYSGYLDGLRQIGGVDRERWLAEAHDALRNSPALWESRPVVIYGYDDFGDAQLATIDTLARSVDAPLTVTLTHEPGRVAFAARAGVLQDLLALGAEHVALEPRTDHYAPASRRLLAHLERGLFESDQTPVPPGAALELLQGTSRRSEMELVVDRVVELLADGLAPHEIAIVARDPAAVAPLADELLTRAGVDHALTRTMPLRASALGRAILGLLACAAGDGDLGDLLAWLRAPGFVRTPGRVDDFERRARRERVGDAAGALALWRSLPGNGRFGLEKVDELASAGSPLALYDILEREVALLFDAPLRGRAAILGPERTVEVSAARAIRAVLSGCRRIARAAPELAPSDARALRAALELATVRSGRTVADGRVQVTSPQQLRARRVRALLLVDLQEGVFPAPTEPAHLLSEQRLAALVGAGLPVLFRRTDQLALERYLFYAAVSRPLEMLVLAWRTADEEGRELNRSLFVDDLLDLVDPQPSPRRSRPLTAGRGGRPPSAVAPLESPELLSLLAERVWSATELERWNRCPVAWLMERLLRVEDLAPDSDALNEGSIAHEVLYEVLAALREEGGARLRPAVRERAIELMRAELARRESDFSASPALARIHRRRMEDRLELYLADACERDAPLEPLQLEFSFGSREECEAPPLDLGGGVLVGGKIDRVDVDGEGGAIVVDYKRKDADGLRAARWISDGKFQAAIYGRAVETLLELRLRASIYQPLSGDIRPRGAIAADAKELIGGVKTDLLADEEFDALIRETLEAARDAALEARAGRLAPRPGTCHREQCRYPALCRLAR